MGPVTWSNNLTEGAQSWANILVKNNTFKHAKGIAPGENLYLSGNPLPEEICTEATTLFYEEVKKYDFNKPGFSMATGHFTQVNFFLRIVRNLLFVNNLLYSCRTLFSQLYKWVPADLMLGEPFD